MKKNSPIYYDEIHLIDLFKIILDGKMKILLITIISFLVGFGYSSQIPKNYLSSLTINSSKTLEFIKLDNIQKLIKSNQPNQLNQSNKFNQPNQPNQLNQSNQPNQPNLIKFIDELKDYEEFLLSIKNTKKVREHFSKFNIQDQEIELFKYAKLLEIVKPKRKQEKYIINFTWHDPDEAKKILKDTLNLTSKNLKKSIHKELLQTLEFEKKLLLNNDNQRLDYLKEQSAIAKELKIIDNQVVDGFNLIPSSVFLNINQSDISYYQRGYKAIDIEIELIQSRDYQNLKLMEQEINSFKKENIKFVDYNVHLMDFKLLKNVKTILVISILLGLIVGIFFVLISNAFQSQKVSKKTN